MLSISIITLFALVMLSIGGIIYCMIRKDYTLGDRFELALIGFSAVFFMLCCVFVGRNARPQDDSCAPRIDTVCVYPSLPDRSLLILAMMSVESGFNPGAEGSSGDTGILQIRQIYVDEVNRILGYKEYNLLDAYDIDRSLEMFDILQSYHNPDGDFIRTIYYHNKSDVYQARIIREYNTMLLYEAMREKLIKRYGTEGLHD